MDNWIAVLDEVLSQADEKTQFVSCHGWGVMTSVAQSRQARRFNGRRR
jgi:hypothetical protein